MSEPSATPRVDACIAEAMARHHSFGKRAGAAYYEEVHQQLAPLARELERAVAAAEKREREAGPLEDIRAERQRQQEVEGWTTAHDDDHWGGELALAAACYAAHAGGRYQDALPAIWPWRREWWKPKNARRDLVRAGALIVAEIERLDRA